MYGSEDGIKKAAVLRKLQAIKTPKYWINISNNVCTEVISKASITKQLHTKK